MTAFGYFLLGSHNFMVIALCSCVNLPLIKHLYTLNFVLSTPLMSLLLLYLETLGNWCAQFRLHSLLSLFPPIHHKFLTLKYTTKDIKLYARTHHIVIIVILIVLFHNVTCYTHSLLSRSHVNISKFLHITCTLVVTSMILWSNGMWLCGYVGFQKRIPEKYGFERDWNMCPMLDTLDSTVNIFGETCVTIY